VTLIDLNDPIPAKRPIQHQWCVCVSHKDAREEESNRMIEIDELFSFTFPFYFCGSFFFFSRMRNVQQQQIM
jgi:hypothetical protein